MDPIVIAFGTALVGAIATDTWQQARDAMTGLWRRVHPQQVDSIGAELDILHDDVVAARQAGDASTERDLEGAWRVRLQQLLGANPELAEELSHVLERALIPLLAPAEQSHVQKILMGTASDRARLSQAGGNVTTIGGDSYTAGRDQHLHKP